MKNPRQVYTKIHYNSHEPYSNIDAHANLGSWRFVCLSVSLCVCVDTYSGTTGYEAATAIPAASELREPEKRVIFLFESEKANMNNHTWLTAI